MAGGGGPSSGTVEPPLSQAYGYGIVVGLGFLFALGMIFTTYVLKKYNHEKQTSEMFNTAGRSVKSGLVASAVVSSWTWAATLLQSSGVAYRYGVSGPFWVGYTQSHCGLSVNKKLSMLLVQQFKSFSLRQLPLS
jgi:Na+/pantothenate symporter